MPTSTLVCHICLPLALTTHTDSFIPERNPEAIASAMLLHTTSGEQFASPAHKKQARKAPGDTDIVKGSSGMRLMAMHFGVHLPVRKMRHLHAPPDEALRVYRDVLKSELLGSFAAGHDYGHVTTAQAIAATSSSSATAGTIATAPVPSTPSRAQQQLQQHGMCSPRKVLNFTSPNGQMKRSARRLDFDAPILMNDARFSVSPITLGSQRLLASPRKAPRHISKVPFKVLDAPDLADDFYLNLVDWGSSNVLSVGLGSCVYLWSACTSSVSKLCDIGPYDTVTSVNWMERGTHVAVGTNRGLVQIWDVAKSKKVRSMAGHAARVGM